METMTAKLIGGPHDGKFIELDRSAYYFYIPVFVPVCPRYVWDFEVDPSATVPTKTMVYVLYAHDRYIPRRAYFVYRGIQ